MILYKYVPAERIDILENESIRYTQPRLLNDPFEMTPHFGALLSSNEIIGVLNFRRIREMVRETKQAAILPGIVQSFVAMGLWVFLQFSSTIKNNMLAVIDTLSRKMKKEWDAQMEKHLTSTIGVLSLSAKHDNLSMWSHYASNHSGLVIAVDETAAIFHESLSDKDELRHLRQVVYSKHKPSLTLQTASGVEFLLRKSVEWEHEDEWRIIKTLDSANAVGLAISPTGGLVDSDVRLFTLPASAIQGVVLGARMAAIYRERLLNLIRTDVRYRHVWIKEARLQKDKFALEFVRLPGRPQYHPVPEIKISAQDLPEVASTELANRIGQIMHLSASKNFFNLSKLATIAVVPSVKSALEQQFKIVWEEQASVALAVPQDDTFVVVGFLSVAAVGTLLVDDEARRADAIHFVHRHLAHVHNLTLLNEMFGHQILTEQKFDVESLLTQVAMTIWNEYLISRLTSISVTRTAIDETIHRLENSIPRVNLEVIQEIEAYRKHRDITHLTRKIQQACATVLGNIAAILGYEDGTGDDILKGEEPLQRLIEKRRLTETIKALSATLRAMNAEYPEWVDVTVYARLNEIIREQCFSWNIAFRDTGKHAYVAVL